MEKLEKVLDRSIKWLGFMETINKYKAEYGSLSKEPAITKNIEGYYFKRINVAQTLAESDYFISLSKLKTCLLTKYPVF